MIRSFEAPSLVGQVKKRLAERKISVKIQILIEIIDWILQTCDLKGFTDGIFGAMRRSFLKWSLLITASGVSRQFVSHRQSP